MSETDRSHLRDVLAALASPVRLIFFEQAIGCDACTPTRQLLEQITQLSPQIELEILNLVLEKGRAAQYDVDRVPATVVSAPRRERIRFYGAPIGHELMALADAIRMTASGESGLTEQSRAHLATLTKPVTLRVFFTPTCVYCPRMITLANQLAIESPLVTATAIDATGYPDLVRRFAVNGVPKTIISDSVEIVGVATEEELVAAIC